MKLSIVTVHLNDFPGLERTLNSLSYVMSAADIEWIVIDGGSKLTREHSDIFRQVISLATQSVSGPDKGIYDAMNKGTKLASGDYIMYLNAGDELHQDFDHGLLSRLVETAPPGMVWGHCMERYENGATIQIKTRSSSWAWYCMPVYHPAIFFRREMLGEDPYDTSFIIAADYDLVCRLLTSGARVVMLDSEVSIFHRGGISLTRGEVTGEEENRIRMKYFMVSSFASKNIMRFKIFIARLSHFPLLRGLWRKWI